MCSMKTKGENIILMDGFCILCNRMVHFIKKRDKHAKFTIIALQSSKGQLWLKKAGLPDNDLDSAVYIKGDRHFQKSSAILHILADLEGFWKGALILLLVPGFIRDRVYYAVAKTRYKIFGRQEYCVNT